MFKINFRWIARYQRFQFFYGFSKVLENFNLNGLVKMDCKHVVEIVPKEQGFYLLYGERGVGKTIMILNIYKCLKDKSVYISLLDKPRTKQQFKKLIGYAKIDDVKIQFARIERHICDRIKFLNKIFQQKILKSYQKSIILIDDILTPIDLDEKISFENLNLLIAFILELTRRGNIIIASSPENPNTLMPVGWATLLLNYSRCVFRLRKMRKIRELIVFKLKNSPARLTIKKYSLIENRDKNILGAYKYIISDEGSMLFTKQ